MELAIRLVLIMAIALVVGVALLTFSQDILNQSQDNLESIGDDNEGEHILRMSSINGSEVAYLMEECKKQGDRHGRETCFAITVDGGGGSPAQGQVQNKWQAMGYAWSNVTHSGYSSGKDSIFIYSDENATIEIVSG